MTNLKVRCQLSRSERTARFDRLSQLGCCICCRPAQIHHLFGSKFRGMGQKAGDEFTIPLCMDHHTGAFGIHSLGMRAWEGMYDLQSIFLERVNKQIEVMTNQGVVFSGCE